MSEGAPGNLGGRMYGAVDGGSAWNLQGQGGHKKDSVIFLNNAGSHTMFLVSVGACRCVFCYSLVGKKRALETANPGFNFHSTLQ